MVGWLLDNLATIIICLVLAAIVAAIVGSWLRRRKRAKASGGCACGCGSCPMSGSCHK